MVLLTLNCWSDSIEYHLLDWQEKKALAGGTAERVTLGWGNILLNVSGKEGYRLELELPDHRTAIGAILDLLTDPVHGILKKPEEIRAVGHRVVHGGERFRQSVSIDGQVLASLRELVDLAPLHNSNNISGIEAALALLPEIPHIAVFDTAFHLTMPRESFIYPLPYEWYPKHGVRRYGFHGPAHLYASRRAAAQMGMDPKGCQCVIVAIGKGISLCAVRNGLSVDTTMGFTPLEGMVMETRCGNIDPGIPAFIMQQQGLSPREVETVLNHKSGLAGIAGTGNRALLIQRAQKGDPRAALALDMEAYRLRKEIGALLAALGGAHAIVFAGGGGYDWYLRERALTGLDFLGIRLDPGKNRTAAGDEETFVSTPDSSIKVLLVPGRVELVLCQEVVSILGGDTPFAS